MLQKRQKLKIKHSLANMYSFIDSEMAFNYRSSCYLHDDVCQSTRTTRSRRRSRSLRGQWLCKEIILILILTRKQWRWHVDIKDVFYMRFKLRGSFQNTLINRISFWNRMAPQQALTIGSLVWAKVEPYPWWPGRVILISFRSLKLSFSNDKESIKLLSSQTLPSTSLYIQHLPAPQSNTPVFWHWFSFQRRSWT